MPTDLSGAEAMAHHELFFEDWRRVDGRDAYGVWLTWERDGKDIGVVTAAVGGRTVRVVHQAGGTTERLKAALASWTIDEVRREVQAGRGRSEPADEVYVLNVDSLAVERLVASDAELPVLVEGEIVGSFDA